MWKGSTESEATGSRLQARSSPRKCPGFWERCLGGAHLLLESRVFRKLLWVSNYERVTPGHPRSSEHSMTFDPDLKMKPSGTIFKQVGGLEASGSELTQMRRQREAVEGTRRF